MSRISMFSLAAVLAALALPEPLMARDYTNLPAKDYTNWALYNPRWYQPKYLPSVDEASNQLQFISPRLAPVTANEELTTGYALQRVDVNRLGINLSFTKSGVDQSVQYFWSWWGGYVAPVTTPYSDAIVTSINYADIADFRLYHNGRGAGAFPAIWCINPISRGAQSNSAFCVASEADAHEIIDALATLVVASGQDLDIPPGMMMSPVSEKEVRNHPEMAGMQVKDMVWDSPPDRAGIKKGDIIRSINGKPCTDETAFAGLFNAAVRAKPEGGIVHLEVLHRGSAQAFDLHYANPDTNLAQLRQQSGASARHPVGFMVSIPDANQAAPLAQTQAQAAAQPSGTEFGFQVRPVIVADVATFGLAGPRGIVVVDVSKGGLAEKMGIQAGDVILEVNDSEINDLDLFRQFIHSGAAKTFHIWRRGQALELIVPVSM